MTTLAASLGDARRSEILRTASERKRELTTGQAAAVALSVTLGLIVAGYGMADSYVTVSALAARQ